MAHGGDALRNERLYYLFAMNNNESKKNDAIIRSGIQWISRPLNGGLQPCLFDLRTSNLCARLTWTTRRKRSTGWLQSH